MSPRKSEVDIALEEWADSAGVERRVEIAQGRFGRGLFATQALSAGELALRVPLSATLSDDHRSRHGAGSAETSGTCPQRSCNSSTSSRHSPPEVAALPRSMMPTTFYHGTSVEAAFSIQQNGFDPERWGTNAGARLRKGVYYSTIFEKAMNYAKLKPAQGVIFALSIDLGRCKTLQRDDPMMKCWQMHIYDSAWAPGGASTSDFEENCVKDPSRIRIVRAIAGNSDKLLEMGMTIDRGKMVMVGD